MIEGRMERLRWLLIAVGVSLFVGFSVPVYAYQTPTPWPTPSPWPTPTPWGEGGYIAALNAARGGTATPWPSPTPYPRPTTVFFPTPTAWVITSTRPVSDSFDIFPAQITCRGLNPASVCSSDGSWLRYSVTATIYTPTPTPTPTPSWVVSRTCQSIAGDSMFINGDSNTSFSCSFACEFNNPCGGGFTEIPPDTDFQPGCNFREIFVQKACHPYCMSSVMIVRICNPAMVTVVPTLPPTPSPTPLPVVPVRVFQCNGTVCPDCNGSFSGYTEVLPVNGSFSWFISRSVSGCCTTQKLAVCEFPRGVAAVYTGTIQFTVVNSNAFNLYGSQMIPYSGTFLVRRGSQVGLGPGTTVSSTMFRRYGDLVDNGTQQVNFSIDGQGSVSWLFSFGFGGSGPTPTPSPTPVYGEQRFPDEFLISSRCLSQTAMTLSLSDSEAPSGTYFIPSDSVPSFITMYTHMETSMRYVWASSPISLSFMPNFEPYSLPVSWRCVRCDPGGGRCVDDDRGGFDDYIDVVDGDPLCFTIPLSNLKAAILSVPFIGSQIEAVAGSEILDQVKSVHVCAFTRTITFTSYLVFINPILLVFSWLAVVFAAYLVLRY